MRLTAILSPGRGSQSSDLRDTAATVRPDLPAEERPLEQVRV